MSTTSPAHRFAGEQIQHHGQISPPAARPDVGHIAAPNLIRLCHCKMPGKKIRDFNMLIAPTFVFMPWYLTTGDT